MHRKIYKDVFLKKTMFNSIKKWLIKRQLQSNKKASAVEAALDDYIKDAMQEHTEASRLAQKILKAKMLRQTTRETLESIHDLDAPDEEQEASMEDTITTLLMTKLLGAPAAKTNEFFNEFGEPTQQTPTAELPPKAAGIAEMAKGLTPAELELIKAKILK